MTAVEYKELRVALGRQKEVAARLGVSRDTIAHRECGDNPITTEAALAMCYLSLVKMAVEEARAKMRVRDVKA